MDIRRVDEHRKRDHLPLLLLADEQEDMVERYLARGTMFVLDMDGATAGVCVVTDEGDRVLEIKNLAVDPAYQRRGLGRALIEFVADRARGRYDALQVGTGDSPLTVPSTRHAALSGTTASRTSSPTTTTTPSWRRASCSKTWSTCGASCRRAGRAALRAQGPDAPALRPAPDMGARPGKGRPQALLRATTRHAVEPMRRHVTESNQRPRIARSSTSE